MTTLSTPLYPAAKAQPRPVYLRVVAEGIALYVLCFGVLSALIFTAPGFAGNDDYYHARMGSEIIVQRRLDINFPWLPQTILSPDRFVDHHLLYHVYLAPFVYYGGMTGAKLAQTAIAAGIFLAMWWLLRVIGVRWAALWTLALFSLSSPFLFRMLMIRTQGAAVVLLILALGVMFTRRHRWLIPLAFAFTWLYDGFVLLPAFAVLYTLAVALVERRLDLRPVLYSGVGVLLGLVINPYFPRNVAFIIEHLGAKVDFEAGIKVGSEWYPYPTAVLIGTSGLALLVLIAGIVRLMIDRRRDAIDYSLLFTALVTLFMLLKSRRFIEYYPPFALLFCAAMWGRIPLNLPKAPPWTGKALAIMALITAGMFTVTGIIATRATLLTSDDPRWFAGASAWLKAHTPPGTPVFQLDWDDFTHLFYNNTSNTYLVGLDPTYLEEAHPDLWTQWVAITRGEVEHPSAVIESVFGAKYVVSDGGHEAFRDRANQDLNMRLVYLDKNSRVWEIISPLPGRASPPG